mgnify:CR=1 FL=1
MYSDKDLRSIALNPRAGEAQAVAVQQCEERGVSLKPKATDYSTSEDHVLHNVASMSSTSKEKKDAALAELGSRE